MDITAGSSNDRDLDGGRVSIAIVAGEHSGDASGAALAEELRKLKPGIRIWGAGGERMKESGVELVADFSWAGAIGILESLKKVPPLLVALAKLKRAIVERSPSVLVLIDFGAFNVRLGTFAKTKGIATVYYFPPGSWRRRPRDFSKMLAAADKFITPFPWSEKFLRDAGADAVFLGHPMLDRVCPSASAAELRREMGIDENGLVIGLLPGSRSHEVKSIMPAFAQAAEIIVDQVPRVSAFIAAAASDESERLIRRSAGSFRKVEFRVLQKRAYDIMAASDLLLTCSGTATLEAAILEKPMIIVYRGTWLMRFEYLFRRHVIEDFAGMPNIIAGRMICPELLGDDASPKNIAASAIRLLSNPDTMEQQKRDLRDVKSVLGETGGTERSARAILEMACQNWRS